MTFYRIATGFFAMLSAGMLFAATAQAQPNLAEIQPDDIVLGEADAPVTLVEYASMSCPHCAAFHLKVLPEIKKNYIDTGKAKLTLRQFPLNITALQAGKLALCSGEERYYPFVQALFETQSKWAFVTDYVGALKTIAKVGGVSTNVFERCMEDEALEERLLTLRQQGAEIMKVQSTPSIFVNGELIADISGPEAISAAIDDALGE